MLLFLLALAIGGLVIGALGRLIVGGTNQIGLLGTIMSGLGGSFLGGLVSRDVLGLRYRYSALIGFVLAVLFAALIVYALSGRSTRR